MGPRTFLTSLETFGIKLGLSNIQALCAALGDPHRAFPSVILAGTNGKGSVAAMTEAALRREGYRTGRYTSPHLVRLEERFALEGVEVDPGQLDAALDAVQHAVRGLQTRGGLERLPTYFEATTAAAFEIFRVAQVDVAVLEVGLGGRFDATNIVQPVAAAITSIARDHELQLGTDLRSIAFEKAGVIKGGHPVIAGPLPTAAMEVVRMVARDRGSPLVEAFDGCAVTADEHDGRITLRLRTPRAEYDGIALALRGRHQVANAAVAVRLLESLASAALPVSRESIAWGLAHARWPGRLDLRSVGPDRAILIDGAHNPEGAAALARYLAGAWPGGLPLVLGVMGDKDVAGILRPLLPLARPLILTRAPGARAADPGAVRSAALAMDAALVVETEPDARAAVEAAWRHGQTVCVAGSLYLAGEVLGRLGLE